MVRLTLLSTAVAMVAFASNSLLCRLALVDGSIDAVSFTTLRVLSAVIVLGLIVMVRDRSVDGTAGNWKSAVGLFLYAACFSLAYREVGAGAGALLLFGSVQVTMIVSGWRQGERTRGIGFGCAIGGLGLLLVPGASAPSLGGAIAMMVAGIGWGWYSLLGRQVDADPLTETFGNFLRALPFAVVVTMASWSQLQLTSQGALLAIASGGLASGLGYVVWYAALAGLTAFRAAVVQLSVPILAAVGGVALLDEPFDLRLAVASVAVLGGIAIELSRQQVSGDGQ